MPCNAFGHGPHQHTSYSSVTSIVISPRVSKVSGAANAGNAVQYGLNRASRPVFSIAHRRPFDGDTA